MSTSPRPSEECRAKVEQGILSVTRRGQLIVGSLGRASVFKALTGDANFEFGRRGQEPLHYLDEWGGIEHRDIDTIRGKLSMDDWQDAYPHSIDERWFQHPDCTIENTADGWIATYRVRGGQALHTTELDPQMFVPFIGNTALEIPCATVRPATHFALLNSDELRQSDSLAKRLLIEVMPDEDKALLETPPYQELIRINSVS